MTYLGNAPGANGFVFMCRPNNTLFYATQCIFDESMFPKCPKLVKRPVTRLHRDNVPPQHYHPVDEEENPPRRSSRTNPRGIEEHEDQGPLLPSTSESTTRERLPALPFAEQSPPREWSLADQGPTSPPRQEETPPPPTTRWLRREKKVPRREGNVYGETCHPVEILQGSKNRKEWQQIEGSMLGTGTPPEPSAPQPGPSQPPPRSPTPSEKEVEGGLYDDDNDEFY